MSALFKWGQRQIRDCQPYWDAVQEWRTVRQWDKQKAQEQEKAEEEDKARKSLEEGWEKVPRELARNPLEHDSANEIEEISLDEKQQNRERNIERVRVAESVLEEHFAQHPDDLELVDYPPARIQRDPERVWQEHVRTCLQLQSASRRRDPARLWDQVQEGYATEIAERSAEPSQSGGHRTPDAGAHQKTHAQRDKMMQENYRDYEGFNIK